MKIENTEKSTEEYIVKETWGTMTLGKKIEYLWMYYKGWLAGALCLVLVICIGVSMYKGIRTKVLLNAVVIGGNDLKAEWLEESFAEYADISEKDGVLQIRTNIPDDGGEMASTTALTTLMGADAIDVLVCPKRVYEDYSAHDGFLDMKELLGAEAGGSGDTILDDGVRLKDENILSKEEMTSYEEIYAAVPVNSQNPEMAAKFIEYLLQ